MRNPRLVIPWSRTRLGELLEKAGLHPGLVPDRLEKAGAATAAKITPVGGITPGGKRVVLIRGKRYYVEPGMGQPGAAPEQPGQKPKPKLEALPGGQQGAQAAPGQPKPGQADQPAKPQPKLTLAAGGGSQGGNGEQPQPAQAKPAAGAPPQQPGAQPQAQPQAKPAAGQDQGAKVVNLNAVQHEATTPPPEGHPEYSPDPTPPQGGIAQASRVGVRAHDTPIPPPVPRLPNLTPDERAVESRFADAFEKDPDKVVAEFRRQLAAGMLGDGPNVYGTDDAKMLSPDYNPSDADDEEVLDRRGRYNTMLHQTANAIAKRAFLEALDELQKLPENDPKRQVLVTSGGVASGKGYAIGNIEQVNSVAKQVGAVWDAAGEQNATENPWVLAECQKRGLKPVFVFVDSDPKETWANPARGVVERAQKKGRMVDARLFADSYALGAQNFKAFHEQHKDTEGVSFVLLENRGTPKLLDSFPEQALARSADDIYQEASQVVDQHQALKPAVRRGAIVGRRIWGAPGQGAGAGAQGPGGGGQGAGVAAQVAAVQGAGAAQRPQPGAA